MEIYAPRNVYHYLSTHRVEVHPSDILFKIFEWLFYFDNINRWTTTTHRGGRCFQTILSRIESLGITQIQKQLLSITGAVVYYQKVNKML